LGINALEGSAEKTTVEEREVGKMWGERKD
jgi:hypothetical protein